MERKNRVGIATLVMHCLEHLVGIFARAGILLAETLRFADKVRTPRDIGLPEKSKVSPAMARRFESAIRKAAKKTIDPRGMRRAKKSSGRAA